MLSHENEKASDDANEDEVEGNPRDDDTEGEVRDIE